MHTRTSRFVAVFFVAALMQATQVASSQAPASANLGRNLAAQCANCHGTNGKSAAEVPSLAGQPASALVQKMKDYRDGKLPASIMHQLAKGYSDEQVVLMADYFSRQPK